MRPKSLLIWIILISCTEKSEQDAAHSILEKQRHSTVANDPVDSLFAAHFVLLDSVLANKYEGKCCPPHRIQEAMRFMDTITGIPAKGDGTSVGWFYDEITEEQYKKWKEWYVQNKASLKWDKTAKKIVRMQE